MIIAFSLSKLPVGSSKNKNFGLFIRALAIAVLCFSPPDNFQGRWFFLLAISRVESGSLSLEKEKVDINKLLPARNKNIDEIRGKVISDYQNHLEKAWLTILKSKYSVVINLETLYSLIPN